MARRDDVLYSSADEAATSGAPPLSGGEEVLMIRKGSTWMVTLALAALLLAIPAPAAAGPGGFVPMAGAGLVGEVGFWAEAWLWVQSIWGEPNGLMACRGDEGMCIDPNGLTACQGDAGGCIDPNG